ncbi:hypothetical protein PESHB5_11600 [Pediococcus parvulus]|nr:hypothetical protein PPA04_12220 [Pediococcus parvulus]GHC08586.1 hypothetical protein GCM10008912_10240 [Pediococcus parvulus]
MCSRLNNGLKNRFSSLLKKTYKLSNTWNTTLVLKCGKLKAVYTSRQNRFCNNALKCAVVGLKEFLD